MSNGYNAFIRKMATKLNEIQKTNEEVNNFLESIPDWGNYCSGDLAQANLIESRPLNKEQNRQSQDDEFMSADGPDKCFKFMSFKSPHFDSLSSLKRGNDNNDKENNDEEEEELDLNQLNEPDQEEGVEEDDQDFQKYFSNGHLDAEDDLKLEDLAEPMPIKEEFH